ncbi:MAG: polysaccharide biosynthesis/export family protein [Gemmatimonadales bacterium]
MAPAIFPPMMRPVGVLGVLAALALGAGPGSTQEASVGGAAYRLRPGDIIEITVWGQEDYSGQFQIDENGILAYPMLGEIDTEDLNIAQLRDTLRTGLRLLFAEPFVTITPRFRIAVLGEVRSPGLYVVDPTLSVLDVVALAGGANPVGDLGKIKVFRGGGETRVSFEEESLRGRSLQEIGIRSGDEVVVPRRFLTRQDLTILAQLLQIGLSIAIFVNTLK